jgi:hypothetical protein
LTAPKEIVDLVNRFEMNYERYTLVYDLYGLTEEEIKIVDGT